MRRQVALLLLSAVSIITAYGQRSSNARVNDAKASVVGEQTISRLEHQMEVLYKTNDAEGLAALLAADFVETKSDGTVMDRAGTLKDKVGYKWETLEFRPVKVTVFGSKATATVEVMGSVRDESVVGGHYSVNWHWTDEWVKTPNRNWQCAARLWGARQPLTLRFFIGSWTSVRSEASGPEDPCHRTQNWNTRLVISPIAHNVSKVQVKETVSFTGILSGECNVNGKWTTDSRSYTSVTRHDGSIFKDETDFKMMMDDGQFTATGTGVDTGFSQGYTDTASAVYNESDLVTNYLVLLNKATGVQRIFSRE